MDANTQFALVTDIKPCLVGETTGPSKSPPTMKRKRRHDGTGEELPSDVHLMALCANVTGDRSKVPGPLLS